MSDPSNIGNQAFVAVLSCGLPPQSCKLEKEAKEIEERAHAQEGVTTASSWFFKQKQGKETVDALANLKSFNGAWKKEHERLARIPWMGTARMLPAALAGQYFDLRARFEREAPAKLAEFMEVYEDWRVTAPFRMGTLFNADEFPSRDLCRERIHWENLVTPLAESEQWTRIALINPEHAAAESTRMNEAITRTRREAHQQTWTDLLGHFTHIIEVLSKDKTRLHETLLGNLNQMLDLIPAYGPLFEDQDLLRAAAAAKETLGTINIEDLRADPAMRTQAVTNARDLLATFGELGRRRFA